MPRLGAELGGRDSGRLVEEAVVMRTTMENAKGRRPNTGAANSEALYLPPAWLDYSTTCTIEPSSQTRSKAKSIRNMKPKTLSKI